MPDIPENSVVMRDYAHCQETDAGDISGTTGRNESGSPVCGTETRCRTETVSVQRNRGGQTTVCSSEAISDGDRIERCSGMTEGIVFGEYEDNRT